MKDKVLEEMKNVFRPEFLNRIDATVVFHALWRRSTSARSSTSRWPKVEKQLTAQGRDARGDRRAKDWLGEKGYDPVFGARPLRREKKRSSEPAERTRPPCVARHSIESQKPRNPRASLAVDTVWRQQQRQPISDTTDRRTPPSRCRRRTSSRVRASRNDAFVIRHVRRHAYRIGAHRRRRTAPLVDRRFLSRYDGGSPVRRCVLPCRGPLHRAGARLHQPRVRYSDGGVATRLSVLPRRRLQGVRRVGKRRPTSRIRFSRRTP